MDDDKKNLFDDDYMNWMILNPDLYGMEDPYDSYEYQNYNYQNNRGTGVSSEAGDSLIIMFLFVIISPFFTLKKLFTGEEVDGTDIGMMIFGFVVLIVAIYIVYKLIQERKAKKAYQQYLASKRQNKSNINTTFEHHNVRTTTKYKATEDNSFKEK